MSSQSFAEAVAALCAAHERELAEAEYRLRTSSRQSLASLAMQPLTSWVAPPVPSLGSLPMLGALGQDNGNEPRRPSKDAPISVEDTVAATEFASSTLLSSGTQSVAHGSTEASTINDKTIIARWVVLVERLGQTTCSSKPVQYDIQPFWAPLKPDVQGPVIFTESTRHLRRSAEVRTIRATALEHIGHHIEHLGGSLYWLTSPDSTWRIVWFSVGVVSLLWDLITIPLLVFDLGTFEDTLNAVALATLVYWAVDLVLQFFLGYRTSENRMERRLSVIGKGYLQTWFVPDLAVLLTDICITIIGKRVEDASSSATSDVLESVRLTKLLRMMRLARLLRARRLRQALSAFFNRIGNSSVLLCLNLTKYVLLVYVFNHYVACVWFMIADWSSVDSWLDDFTEDSTSTLHKYLLALHWSLTQFSPSSQNIAPINQSERFFACIISLAAILVFTTLVSNFTNAVNQIRALNMDFYVEQKRLREFMQSRGVSPKLFSQIQIFFRHNYYKNKATLMEEDVTFIVRLPESLRKNLHVEMHLPALREHHVFFYLCPSHHSDLLMRCAHEAMKEITCLEGHDFFVSGAVAKGMIYPVTGGIDYEITRRVTAGFDMEEQVHVKRPSVRQWFSEMSLWVVWCHAGRLFANAQTSAIMFHLSAFEGILTSWNSDTALYSCLRAMAIFCSKLAEDVQESGDKLTDMPCDAETMMAVARRARQFSNMGPAMSISRLRRSADPEGGVGGWCR